MAIPIAEQVLGVLKEGLSAWKMFISTREEAYKRKMDVRKREALEAAEMYIRIVSKTEFGKDKSLKKYEDRFFKFNA
jgi:hypothetical protein